jgi:hypothetical protein
MKQSPPTTRPRAGAARPSRAQWAVLDALARNERSFLVHMEHAGPALLLFAGGGYEARRSTVSALVRRGWVEPAATSIVAPRHVSYYALSAAGRRALRRAAGAGDGDSRA